MGAYWLRCFGFVAGLEAPVLIGKELPCRSVGRRSPLGAEPSPGVCVYQGQRFSAIPRDASGRRYPLRPSHQEARRRTSQQEERCWQWCDERCESSCCQLQVAGSNRPRRAHAAVPPPTSLPTQNSGCAAHMVKDDTPSLPGWCFRAETLPFGNRFIINSLQHMGF